MFIFKEYKLPSSAIFGRSCKRLAEIQEYDHVTIVLKNIEQNGMVSAKEKDDILLAVVKVIAQQGQVRDVWKRRYSFLLPSLKGGKKICVALSFCTFTIYTMFHSNHFSLVKENKLVVFTFVFISFWWWIFCVGKSKSGNRFRRIGETSCVKIF